MNGEVIDIADLRRENLEKKCGVFLIENGNEREIFSPEELEPKAKYEINASYKGYFLKPSLRFTTLGKKVFSAIGTLINNGYSIGKVIVYPIKEI